MRASKVHTFVEQNCTTIKKNPKINFQTIFKLFHVFDSVN